MTYYISLLQGEGPEDLEPILTSSDPHVTSAVCRTLGRVLDHLQPSDLGVGDQGPVRETIDGEEHPVLVPAVLPSGVTLPDGRTLDRPSPRWCRCEDCRAAFEALMEGELDLPPDWRDGEMVPGWLLEG